MKWKCFVCKVNVGQFSFPKEEDKLQRWITALNIDRPKIVGANGPRICLKHFEQNDFTQNSPLSRVICPTKFKIGGHSNPFGGSSITYVGSVCHQSRVIWSWGAHSALTSWSRWFYTVKWSKLAIFSGLSGRFLGVVWWFQSFLQVRTCLYLDDPVKFWKKN